MTRDDFWKTVERLDPEDATSGLTDRLELLQPSELVSFEEHFCRVFRLAYDHLLWNAAYLIEEGCSDDGFMDFRYGLISRGKRFFESALHDPDSLADMLTDEDFIPNEEFGSVAAKLYERKTGKDMPYPELPPNPKPSGERWNCRDPRLCAEKLPKLWRRYGGE